MFYTSTTIIIFVFSMSGGKDGLIERMVSFQKNKTHPVVTTTIAVGYMNVLNDVYILVLPVSGVVRLNLPKRRKIGVILIFMTGLL